MNRVIDTIHRGLCTHLDVPFDAVSMFLETPSSENLDLYVSRVRSWRRTVLRSRLPSFCESFLFVREEEKKISDEDWQMYEQRAASELKPGRSIRYWWGSVLLQCASSRSIGGARGGLSSSSNTTSMGLE